MDPDPDRAAVRAVPPPPPSERAAAHPADLVREVTERVSSRREAIWIVEHARCTSGRGGRNTDPEAVRATALDLAGRRASGEPLQYVLGTWQFRLLELTVDRRVLIPRPETEQVVEVALSELTRIAAGRGADDGPIVCADLGSGSGAIALSLAVEGAIARPDIPLEIWATDRSPDALDVVRANLAALFRRDPVTASRVTPALGAWFDALPDRLARQVDLVVSNPPYVSAEEYADLDPSVRQWEPVEALVAPRGASGVAGLADIEVVVAGAARWLRPSGALVVELAPPQAYGAIDAARRAGFARVGTARDLAGRLRMLVAER